jgi:hypothetical protein
MSDKNVIEENHLNDINQLREQSTDLVYRLGQIEMELIAAEQRLDELKRAKTASIDEYKELQRKEADIVKTLTEKYGTGTLNIDSGEFIAS